MHDQELLERIRRREKRAIARGLTWIERDQEEGRRLVRSLFPLAGQAHIVGITGAPGVGKSTLVNALTMALRKRGLTVGILAVDPSSPFSGGAILGDRIRMQESVMDPGVFMRSLASRGHLGGLSRATFGAVTLLDAAGFDVVLIETVGAGQSEVEIMQLAQSTMVVLAPGLGDDIQAIKAGILEIGQIFVVNKADREGADHTARAIRGMLTLSLEHPDWFPPIVKTVAEGAQGLDELIAAMTSHRSYLAASGKLASIREGQTAHMLALALEDLVAKAVAGARQTDEWNQLLQRVSSGDEDAVEAAWGILERMVRGRHHGA
ncbi:methylmalonyl Co-A mutase-associated GTPase MeaB [Sulfobacillus harzensis]|uniref:Methylmalonyl Co-A mutase-associated GTPase MeaB n=1 Tax=Sulfobacillus harzensis TaxID=2729629 RepID=A0A7Y0Q2W6_9FIRM|nr:methylmalonyl Co-A mutase-associated GTPase MeaB [Sulfobacillus harzensis]NMP23583.1 methylmalonyl Co-A mutase-associated GTPase MeaB [Sulfobacillus harzensis]